MSWSIDTLQRAWRLAGRQHDGQKYGGPRDGEQVEYLNHIGSVTLEIMAALRQTDTTQAELALLCAVLHDTIEDTALTYDAIAQEFGTAVADGVQALSKNDQLPGKAAQMADSLRRIQAQPHAVWMVKLADRICNLSEPPFYWDDVRKRAYRAEAQQILDALGEGHPYLAARLAEKIAAYGQYITATP